MPPRRPPNAVYPYNPLWIIITRFFYLFYKFISLAFGLSKTDLGGLEIIHVPMRIEGLHPALHGYRIVQLSDLHLGTWMNRNRLEKIVAVTNRQEPSMIVITGDFINHTGASKIADLYPLSELKSSDGCLAVLGNHDHWVDPTAIKPYLSTLGVDVLVNQTRSINHGEGRLWIVGVDDVLAGEDSLEKALVGIEDISPAILLVHEPDYAETSSLTQRFSFQLSGHTHGGQVALPFLGRIMLPRMGKKYPAGIYQVNGMTLYVNRGAGTTSLQVRWRCPPEITVFTLWG